MYIYITLITHLTSTSIEFEHPVCLESPLTSFIHLHTYIIYDG